MTKREVPLPNPDLFAGVDFFTACEHSGFEFVPAPCLECAKKPEFRGKTVIYGIDAERGIVYLEDDLS